MSVRQSFIGVWLALAVLTGAPAVQASDLGDFNDAVADAYDHYRAAAFYFRTGNSAVAKDELTAMQDAWAEIAARFADSPPDAFTDDPHFADVLDEVSDRVQQAIEAADVGATTVGADALAPIRALLSDLRRRNGVVVFSDHVNALNQQMERLWRYRHNPPALDDPAEVDAVVGEAAVYAYLLQRLREGAPQEVKERADFQRLMEGTGESVARIPVALREGDEETFINTLRELISFDRMLFLRFG